MDGKRPYMTDFFALTLVLHQTFGTRPNFGLAQGSQTQQVLWALTGK